MLLFIFHSGSVKSIVRVEASNGLVGGRSEYYSFPSFEKARIINLLEGPD